MIDRRTLVVAGLGFVLSTQALQAQNRPEYRGFQLGGSVRSVSTLTKVAASEARTVHLRPALMQELQWRPSFFLNGSGTLQRDSVRQIVFSFYNDQLSKMAVDYDTDRTAGMTDADMIDAISTTYGPPSTSAVTKTRAVPSHADDESGTAVARWGDADHSVVLYRSTYASRFRIVVTSPPLEALARTADAQAIRLDEREAPQREIARQKKEVEDTRVSQEKARAANKATFRP